VDRVERRTSEMKAEAVRVAEGDVSLAEQAGVPAAAFDMPLEQAGIKEHVFNILTESGIETVGSLMVKMKLDPNSVLGLPGIGPKAIQNIEESLAVLTFPEPVPAEPVTESEPEAAPEAVTESQPEGEAVVVEAASVPAEEMALTEKQVPAKKDARKHVEEEEEDEGHKDGVSLDDLFTLKPEIFQATTEVEDEDSKDKKKGKKGKKKSVALEFDEELGEVVSRKKHKRGDDSFGEDW
jgi:transcription termination/antitermination protein NusA